MDYIISKNEYYIIQIILDGFNKGLCTRIAIGYYKLHRYSRVSNGNGHFSYRKSLFKGP